MPTAVWRAAVASRRELNEQRSNLQGARRNIAEQLRNPMVDGVDRQGLERQVVDLDARIAALDKSLAVANERVASTALVPGAVVEPPNGRGGPPDAVYILSGMFIVVVLLPMSVAFAIRLLRRKSAAILSMPQDMIDRFTRIDQAVDAMAVEVERLGEGQRFVTRIIAERSAPEPIALERDRSSSR